MWKLNLVVLALRGTSALISRSWAGQQRIDRLSVNYEAMCKVSHVTRYDMMRKRNPVFFSTSPLDDMEQPRIEPMNSTPGEQWEFDGVSEDGIQAFVFGFYRDPNFSFFGAGNLRVYTEFAFANGSRYAIVDYAEESTIESCRHTGTRGIWKANNWTYMFEISADMSHTKITVNNPEAEITVSMASVAPPRYADGSTWPSTNASLLTVPHFYWTEPVPVAEVTVDATIYGETLSWSGMGGHERLWGAFNWFTCLNSLLVARLRAGPFALSFLEFGSGRQQDILVSSVVLSENGKHVFGTRKTKSETEDYIRVRKLYTGQGITTKALKDKVTGMELVLVSPSRNRRWEFSLTHKNLAFEYNLGSGRGGSAYAGMAVGGLVGETTFTGPAFSEVMRFPTRSMLLTKNFVH